MRLERSVVSWASMVVVVRDRCVGPRRIDDRFVLIVAGVVGVLRLPGGLGFRVQQRSVIVSTRLNASTICDAQGHASAMLAASLPVAARLGIDSVLVTCDATNVGSRRVIEANGGVFEDQRAEKLRYWIPTR